MFGFDNSRGDQQAGTVMPSGAPTVSDVTPPPASEDTGVSLPAATADDAAAADDSSKSFIATDDKGNLDHVVPGGDHAELLKLKQEALQKLTPLIDHLEQSPEEKFKTTMMMIQAADDQALVPVAYQAANEIKDERTRAQALLDIVNEINYFTQAHEKEK